MPDLAVVVPVYDNLETLPAMVDGLTTALEASGLDWQVTWVDDASRDGSWDWLRDHCRHSSRHVALRLDRNHGQSLAVCVGLAHAPAGATVVTIDADLEYSPEEIAAMASAVRDPWYFVAGVRDRHGDRLWSSAAFNVLTRVLTGDRVGDVGCGFMALGPQLAATAGRADLHGLALRPFLSSRASTTVRHVVRFHPRGRTATGPTARARIAIDVLAGDPRPTVRLYLIMGVAIALRASGRCRSASTAVGGLAAVTGLVVTCRRRVLRSRLAGAPPTVAARSGNTVGDGRSEAHPTLP